MNTRTVSQSNVQEKWYLVDAKGLRIGKVSSAIAQLLLGKNNVDTRAYLMPQNKVVVINAAEIDVTPKRADTKFYTQYSGFPGGIKYTFLKDMMAKFPGRVIENAVSGMLPKNKRGKHIMASNLFIYANADHKHEAQKPEVIDLNTYKI